MVYLGNSGYIIATFHSPRLLNPKKMKNSEKIFIFCLIFEVMCFHQSSNLTFVVSKWSHNVTVPQQAASEMGVGLPQPAYRSRLQTAVSGFG